MTLALEAIFTYYSHYADKNTREEKQSDFSSCFIIS